MYLLNCQYCGQEIERDANKKLVTCFDCRMKYLNNYVKIHRPKKRIYKKRKIIVPKMPPMPPLTEIDRIYNGYGYWEGGELKLSARGQVVLKEYLEKQNVKTISN